MNIRPAQPQDAAEIAHVHVASWQTTYAGILSAETLANLSVERRTLQWQQAINQPASSKTCLFVAQDNTSKLLGFASGGPQRDESLDYDGELYAIYLLKEAQQQGLGKQLFSAVAEDLQKNQLNKMLVWVLKDNPAVNFYLKLGGQLITEKPIEINQQTLIEQAYGWNNFINPK